MFLVSSFNSILIYLDSHTALQLIIILNSIGFGGLQAVELIQFL